MSPHVGNGEADSTGNMSAARPALCPGHRTASCSEVWPTVTLGAAPEPRWRTHQAALSPRQASLLTESKADRNGGRAGSSVVPRQFLSPDTRHMAPWRGPSGTYSSTFKSHNW